MTSLRNAKSLIPNHLLPWLEVVAIAAWGVLILKYWLTDKLNLLIHPDFFWLVILAAIGLLTMSFCKSLQLWHKIPPDQITSGEQHINVFPPGWSSSLLLVAAVLGFIISPQVFASQTALNREVTEILGATRTQPQTPIFGRLTDRRRKKMTMIRMTIEVESIEDAIQLLNSERLASRA